MQATTLARRLTGAKVLWHGIATLDTAAVLFFTATLLPDSLSERPDCSTLIGMTCRPPAALPARAAIVA